MKHPQGLPINFLLNRSDAELENFELALLARAADVRSQLEELYNVLTDVTAQAATVRWFRTMDRAALKHAIENEETPEEWAKRMIRDSQRGEEDLDAGPMTQTELFRGRKRQQRNNLAGKL